MFSVAGMCDGGLEEGIVAATRDDTTINAHDVVSTIYKFNSIYANLDNSDIFYNRFRP